MNSDVSLYQSKRRRIIEVLWHRGTREVIIVEYRILLESTTTFTSYFYQCIQEYTSITEARMKRFFCSLFVCLGLVDMTITACVLGYSEQAYGELC
jgi:hypothetical protein